MYFYRPIKGFRYGQPSTTITVIKLYRHSQSYFESEVTLWIRHQSVKVDNMLSNENVWEYRILQGTVLGPSLFNLYINSLFSLNCNAEITGFAEDSYFLQD